MSGILMAVVNSPTTPSIPAGPTVIGEAWGGGYYAGQISTTGNGVATHYLVVAPIASGEAVGVKWKTSDTSTSGTSSLIDGPTNTANMDDANHPAAKFCADLTIGGYTDWYMPAKNELEICYYNLKPTTASNSTKSGTNTNAVPSRGSNYTAGTPSQTSANDFKDTGTQDFVLTNYYWSSTERAATEAWAQEFQSGQQYAGTKLANERVRAVRRIPV